MIDFVQVLEEFCERAQRAHNTGYDEHDVASVVRDPRLGKLPPEDISPDDFPDLEKWARISLRRAAALRADVGPRGPAKRVTKRERQDQTNAATRRWRARQPKKLRKVPAPKPEKCPRVQGRDPVKLAAYKLRERERSKLRMRAVRAARKRAA